MGLFVYVLPELAAEVSDRLQEYLGVVAGDSPPIRDVTDSVKGRLIRFGGRRVVSRHRPGTSGNSPRTAAAHAAFTSS